MTIDLETDGLTAYLSWLLEKGCIQEFTTAAGITRQVIARGVESLTAKQLEVFEEVVVPCLGHQDCTRCGCPISWPDMIQVGSNGGMCAYCAHQAQKDE